jgi:hypothetical protein
MIITCGLYTIYWLVATKLELNKSGATIPSAWLIIIPFVNIYFLYEFAQGYCKVVFGDDRQAIAYFVLILFTLPIGAIIYQSQINKMAVS